MNFEINGDNTQMGDIRKGGYIAIARTIFDHPLLKNPKWHIAWEWLIANAAWEASSGARLSRGVAPLKRGQIAFTIRSLAESWDWPRGNVEYFLRRLEGAKMVTRQKIQTSFQTSFQTSSSYAATLLTICNYDRFQSVPKSRKRKVGHDFRQDFGQMSLDVAVNQSLLGSNHLNQTNHKSPESGATKNIKKPTHLSVSTDGKWLWTDYGTTEWDDYAADYETVKGTARMPENYIGGRGYWFYKDGAALWPPDKRRKRA